MFRKIKAQDLNFKSSKAKLQSKLLLYKLIVDQARIIRSIYLSYVEVYNTYHRVQLIFFHKEI